LSAFNKHSAISKPDGLLMTDYKLTHLKQLEAESIHIIREVAAEFERPVMLYSVPVAACGYHLEVQGNDRVSRPDGQESGP
jgi:hypothetical protein